MWTSGASGSVPGSGSFQEWKLGFPGLVKPVHVRSLGVLSIVFQFVGVVRIHGH